MKSVTKIVTAAGIVWLVSLFVLYTVAVVLLTPQFLDVKDLHHILSYFVISVIFLSTMVSAAFLVTIYFLFVRRLRNLDREISAINLKSLHPQHITTSDSNDELAHIAAQVNCILDFINRPQSNSTLIDRLTELEKVNQQLRSEVDKRKMAEREFIIHKERLMKLAHYDALTGLPNRVFFNELLNKAIVSAKRHRQYLAILIVDFDQFKNINDKYGKQVGNNVLKEITHRFKSLLREGDVVARLGSDEFILLLNDIENPKYAGPIAEKVLQSCRQPILVEGKTISCQASIGIAVFPIDGSSLEELQKHADLALHKARHAGGNLYQYYRREMGLVAQEYTKREAALRKAIENKEFVLYYQPLLSLKTGSIKAVEALIRWNSPQAGLIRPTRFIPFAEETGMIMPIGEWALFEACRANKAWQEAGYEPITVSVNVSPKQFYHQNVEEVVANALKQSGLDPSYLVIEITESIMMQNMELTLQILNNLRKMGVQISIDDYGTGFTSINSLKQFPVNILKIDQSFIKGMAYNTNDASIVSSIISLGHNLGLKVIAEGVESTEQIRYLAEHGCDLIQGYFFSRPLPENKIILQLNKKKKKEKQV